MEQETIQRSGDNIWKIVLALICIGILGYGIFYSKYLIGFNLPLALIIWGIFYTAVARKRGVKIGGFSFLAIFICMIQGGLIRYFQEIQEAIHQQKQEAKQMLLEIHNQYSKMIEAATDSQGLPKRIEKPINTTPKERGELGGIERFVKDFMAQMTLQRNACLEVWDT
ncbi:MAG: hypothetical protein L3J18_08265 [Candidatus Brocadia sp.]|nr:MAG: hypothetical protein L3J18_08265 [Candidatus Brocadia sp.]